MGEGVREREGGGESHVIGRRGTEHSSIKKKRRRRNEREKRHRGGRK